MVCMFTGLDLLLQFFFFLYNLPFIVRQKVLDSSGWEVDESTPVPPTDVIMTNGGALLLLLPLLSSIQMYRDTFCNAISGVACLLVLWLWTSEQK